MPNIPKTASPIATKLIIGEEALKLIAYLCPANILTIGAGHKLLPKFDASLFNITPVHLDELIKQSQAQRRVTSEAEQRLRISKETALELLEKDINHVVLFIRSVTHVDLNQNQLDALTSFIFNIGQGNYATSSVRKALDKGYYQTAARDFELWNKDHNAQGEKIISRGLVIRRAAERALFETPVQ